VGRAAFILDWESMLFEAVPGALLPQFSQKTHSGSLNAPHTGQGVGGVVDPEAYEEGPFPPLREASGEL
jgi:hypothetical protein